MAPSWLYSSIFFISIIISSLLGNATRISTYIGGKRLALPSLFFRQNEFSSQFIERLDGTYPISLDEHTIGSIHINHMGKSLAFERVDYGIVTSNAIEPSLLDALVDKFRFKIGLPSDSKSSAATLLHQHNGAEIVDWVSTEGIPLIPLPRTLVHKYNLLHKGIGALIFNSKGDIFVHQRAATKRLFPSMWDMFIGGVSATKESAISTLIRELKEEAGLDFVNCLTVGSSVSSSASSSELSSVPLDSSLFPSSQIPATRGESTSASHSDSPTIPTTTTAASTMSTTISSTEDITMKINNDKLKSKTYKNQKNVKNYHNDDIDNNNDNTNSSSIPSLGSIIYLGSTTIQTSYNHCLVDTFACVCLSTGS